MTERKIIQINNNTIKEKTTRVQAPVWGFVYFTVAMAGLHWRCWNLEPCPEMGKEEGAWKTGELSSLMCYVTAATSTRMQ